MISEAQARHLLETCEELSGRPLEDLRKRLARHKDVLGALWELIVLYTSSRLGAVTHEPSDSVPDVLLHTRTLLLRLLNRFLGRRSSIWIEATHITWGPRTASSEILNFIDWIRNELTRARI